MRTKKKTEVVCTSAHLHTPAPTGYFAWHEWAEEMMNQGWMQERCPGCGLLKIWKPPFQEKK